MRRRTIVCTTLDGSQNMLALRRYIHVHILFDPTGLAGLVSHTILLRLIRPVCIHSYITYIVYFAMQVSSGNFYS